MLVPAAASELRSASKFTVSSQQSGTKAVQIKVNKPLLISLHCAFFSFLFPCIVSSSFEIHGFVVMLSAFRIYFLYILVSNQKHMRKQFNNFTHCFFVLINLSVPMY